MLIKNDHPGPATKESVLVYVQDTASEEPNAGPALRSSAPLDHRELVRGQHRADIDGGKMAG